MKPLLVIPMTGVSARFTAVGYTVPKFMLELDGKKMIEHVIDLYPGWDDVVFVCNAIHLDNPALGLERLLLSRRPAATIVRVEQPSKGPGDAVLIARDHIPLDRPVVVNYCDFTMYWDAQTLATRLYSGEVDGVIPCYTGFHPHMAFSTSYAYVKHTDGIVDDIQEKMPWTDEPNSEFASVGTYAFSSGQVLLDSLDAQVEQNIDLGGEFYLSLTYKPLLAAGGRVEVMPVQHFMQWGTPQDLEEYRDTSRSMLTWTDDRIRTDTELSTDASRVILASGAGQRFVDAGYAVPKPVLEFAGDIVLNHALAGLPGNETIVVTRADLPQNNLVEAAASRVNADVVTLPALSRGQAESALVGLRAIAGAGPVTVGSCDALLSTSATAVNRAFELAGPNGLVVWLAKPYNAATRSPHQYGWAATDGESITGVWLKQDPSDLTAGVIVGNFSFGSRNTGVQMIESLIEDDERVNGEFYLDSLVERALGAGVPVIPLIVDGYISVGTPTEYETAKYWQSCFHKWAAHPYSAAGDPLISPSKRVELDADWRDFNPGALLTR